MIEVCSEIKYCNLNMRIKIYGVLFTKQMYIVYENENKKSLVLKIMDIIGLEKSIYFFGENSFWREGLSFVENFHTLR